MYNSNTWEIDDIDFEWDPEKAAINLAKHGVSFEDAMRVFFDPYARLFADPDHSGDEERFVIVGMDLKARVLTVCHCQRGLGNVVRIISARKATKMESAEYWRYCHEG